MIKVFKKTLLIVLVAAGIFLCMSGCTRNEDVKTSMESGGEYWQQRDYYRNESGF